MFKENKTKRWFGSHDGVRFEINNFDEKKWTYYLILDLNKIPDISELFWLKGEPDIKGRVFYAYSNSKEIQDIDFHCGCTWYSKERGFDGENKVIKIGCDYSHIWDEWRQYTLEDIKRDVIKSVNSFKEIVPKYKYWCRGNGGLYDLEDGVLNKDTDTFTSNEWLEEVDICLK